MTGTTFIQKLKIFSSMQFPNKSIEKLQKGGIMETLKNYIPEELRW